MTARTIPTLPTWTAGKRVLGSDLASMVSYSQFWSSPPMFRMVQTIAQTINNVSTVQFTYDTVTTPGYDTEGGRFGSTPYYYVIPTGMTGRWGFSWVTSWAPNATGNRLSWLAVNNSVLNDPVTSLFTPNANNGANIPASSTTINVNAGDLIGIYAYQSSGGNLNTGGNGFFEGRLISLANP